jgi:8-oxo-dGTP pyrophosphatase MutT (NUDIX family)
MMKAEFRETWFRQGEKIEGKTKTISLPFGRVSARALILRRRDGAILGTLHREGGELAPPGGAVDAGESPDQAVEREIREENIQLVGDSGVWKTRFDVSYYDGYGELSIWYLFNVEDAVIGECDENILTRWVDQGEDVWYPNLREQMLLMMIRTTPELVKYELKTT